MTATSRETVDAHAEGREQPKATHLRTSASLPPEQSRHLVCRGSEYCPLSASSIGSDAISMMFTVAQVAPINLA
jgi:hypothetical protein